MSSAKKTPITAEQVRSIWALANKVGLGREEVYGLVLRFGATESMKAMTRDEADGLLHHLRRASGEERTRQRADGGAEDTITKAQSRALWAKMKQLRWEKATLAEFIEKKTGVADEKWLSTEQARAVLTAMQNLIDRNNGLPRRRDNKRGAGRTED